VGKGQTWRAGHPFGFADGHRHAQLISRAFDPRDGLPVAEALVARRGSSTHDKAGSEISGVDIAGRPVVERLEMMHQPLVRAFPSELLQRQQEVPVRIQQF
jgi:hypothetical protein